MPRLWSLPTNCITTLCIEPQSFVVVRIFAKTFFQVSSFLPLLPQSFSKQQPMWCCLGVSESTLLIFPKAVKASPLHSVNGRCPTGLAAQWHLWAQMPSFPSSLLSPLWPLCYSLLHKRHTLPQGLGSQSGTLSPRYPGTSPPPRLTLEKYRLTQPCKSASRSYPFSVPIALPYFCSHNTYELLTGYMV